MKYLLEYHTFRQELFSSAVKKHSKSFIRLASQIQTYCTQLYPGNWTIGYRKNDNSAEMKRIYEMIIDNDKNKRFITANIRPPYYNNTINMLSFYVDLTGTKFQFKYIRPNTKAYVYAYETLSDIASHKFIILGDFDWIQCLKCLKKSRTIEQLYQNLQEESKNNNSKVAQ